MPNNIHGYFDLGFNACCSESTNLQKKFYEYDFTEIAEYAKKKNSGVSISRMGESYLIGIGNIATKCEDGNHSPLGAGINNFIEIFSDGSARYRVLLASNQNNAEVDIGALMVANHTFSYIYKMIFGSNYYKIFVNAQKYTKLTVIKQFTPVYRTMNDNEETSTFFEKYLSEHKNKYGNNLIIIGDRVPTNDFAVIDRRSFDRMGKEYNNENLIEELFNDEHVNLGYLDIMKTS